MYYLTFQDNRTILQWGVRLGRSRCLRTTTRIYRRIRPSGPRVNFKKGRDSSRINHSQVEHCTLKSSDFYSPKLEKYQKDRWDTETRDWWILTPWKSPKGQDIVSQVWEVVLWVSTWSVLKKSSLIEFRFPVTYWVHWLFRFLPRSRSPHPPRSPSVLRESRERQKTI